LSVKGEKGERNGRRRNNKERVERSDFWLCAEEKLSETRPRKIRAGAGAVAGAAQKLKDLFEREGWEITKVGLGTWMFFKEGK